MSSERTYTVTDLYEAATYAVYGEHTSGEFGRREDRQAIAQALSERLGLTLRPEMPERVKWDADRGIVFGDQEETTIVLDLSLRTRDQRYSDIPLDREKRIRESALLSEFARCYNAIREAERVHLNTLSRDPNGDPLLPEFYLDLLSALGIEDGRPGRDQRSTLPPPFLPISQAPMLHEEPTAIEYREGSTGRTYVHTYGTAFWRPDEGAGQGRGYLSVDLLKKSGITEWRLRPDLVPEDCR